MSVKKRGSSSLFRSYLLHPIRYTLVRCMLSTLFLISLPFPANAADWDTINTEQAKQEYRLYLQKLKQLNNEYKQVTGQMAQVIKEEGLPTWDSGGLDQTLNEIFPADASVSPEGVRFKETFDELVISIDIPGIKRDSLKISIKEGVNMSLSAQRKGDEKPKNVQLAVKLPSAVQDTGARASYEDGVVTVRFTKLHSQEKAIPVV